jgi:hypothetical protein
VDRVDEAHALIRRLERIDALEREGAHPATMLAELRELVREAEAWARREGDERAIAAAERLAEHATVATLQERRIAIVQP